LGCYELFLLHFIQELNVKKLTVSSEKDKYGIHLKAEPDNQTLGRRLKGAFKQVSQAIKGQSSMVCVKNSAFP
jgi:isoleucyl-tRNA synthetase